MYQQPTQYEEPISQYEEPISQYEEPITQKNECKYNNKIIEIKSESLDNERKLSEIIKYKIDNTKYFYNFSYLVNTEPINISEIEDEITNCDLERDSITEYVLCEYTNRNGILIKDFFDKKITELDSKIIIRLMLDFYVTLEESLKFLYKETKIVHYFIDENNIIISEEQMPIIKNFKNAKIEETDNKINETNETTSSFDIFSLTKTFLNILNSLSIPDEIEIITEYRGILEKIIAIEPEQRSINELMNL
jgi:hypothetical protein